MQRRTAGLVAVVAVLALTFGGLLPPFDLLTFLHAGRAVLGGQSPYAGPHSPVFLAGHAFVYPLYVAWLFAPLAALPEPVAVTAYLAASVAAIGAACRMLGRRGAGATALVLVSSTTVIGLQMGTLNPFLLLGLAGAWHLRERRPYLSGALLGVACMAKLFLVPVLLWPALRRRYRQGTAAVATAIGLVLLSGGLGSLSPVGYVEMMAKLDSHEQATSWSLSSFLQGLGLARGPAATGTLVVAAAGVAAVWWYRRRLSDAQLLSGLVVCSLLVSPILWSSYLLLLTVPLVLATRSDALLALFAVVSWAVVTPDAAPLPRVLVGAAVAVVVALVVGGAAAPIRVRWRPVQLIRRRSWRLGPAALAGAGFGLVMAVAPGPARSPLPALAVIAVVAVRCLRPEPGRPSLRPG